jgi:hypothetical protein
VTVDKTLARDRELRAHATPRPWHHSGPGPRLRLVGPLPQESVVVDPYRPNPQDAPLILHRVNTYEELESEIERLREALRAARTLVDSTRHGTNHVSSDEALSSLVRDLEARIDAVLADRRPRAVIPLASEDASP